MEIFTVIAFASIAIFIYWASRKIKALEERNPPTAQMSHFQRTLKEHSKLHSETQRYIQSLEKEFSNKRDTV